MNLDELRIQLEEDLAWRFDELRHLRNTLLGSLDHDAWPASALRTILVMQYAHLEGFAHNAFRLYVDAINARKLRAHQVRPHLFACALTPEFNELRLGGSDQEDMEGRLTRRASSQVKFVNKLRSLNEGEILIDADRSISMEMNFGADVLRRTMLMLAIPESEVNENYYRSLEFVRRARNDIAHGSRREVISPRLFERHQKVCEQFMNELTRIITAAVRQEWFMAVN
jgi:hypothetical protein